MFGLIETLDEIYALAHAQAPFPPFGLERNNLLHMCFVICHRALLSAATSIGAGHPEDGPPITRRALEAAKVALAITMDSGNLEQWRAYDKRKLRWEDRADGSKPKGGSVQENYKGVAIEPLYSELQSFIAVLSDAIVHFTPEHVLSYEWRWAENSDGTTSLAFGVKEHAVANGMLLLADQHRLILRVFDRCLNGQLYANSTMHTLVQQALTQYKNLVKTEGLTEHVGDAW
jgi:hypothetical protein